jgi:hypothetical protein
MYVEHHLPSFSLLPHGASKKRGKEGTGERHRHQRRKMD